jgi:hypothetical protein
LKNWSLKLKGLAVNLIYLLNLMIKSKEYFFQNFNQAEDMANKVISNKNSQCLLSKWLKSLKHLDHGVKTVKYYWTLFFKRDLKWQKLFKQVISKWIEWDHNMSMLLDYLINKHKQIRFVNKIYQEWRHGSDKNQDKSSIKFIDSSNKCNQGIVKLKNRKINHLSLSNYRNKEVHSVQILNKLNLS